MSASFWDESDTRSASQPGVDLVGRNDQCTVVQSIVRHWNTVYDNIVPGTSVINGDWWAGLRELLVVGEGQGEVSPRGPAYARQLKVTDDSFGFHVVEKTGGMQPVGYKNVVLRVEVVKAENEVWSWAGRLRLGMCRRRLVSCHCRESAKRNLFPNLVLSHPFLSAKLRNAKIQSHHKP
ncbi:hypothetical protein K438DRAFT_1767228 [Mycena galopus ATCC 62051]|nr:hypothetical protein K438DRAFT_1767228 [Mycena galopus ATCC 62051]